MITNEEYSCPECGQKISLSQSPTDSGNIDGVYYYYEWLCHKCGILFRQFYKLVWEENEAYGKPS